RARSPRDRRPETKLPTWTWPSVGRSSMAMRRKSVVFPAPLGPSTTHSSPCPTSRFTSRRAGSLPKRLPTRVSRIMRTSPWKVRSAVLDVRLLAQVGDEGIVLALELRLADEVGKLVFDLVERVGALR